MKYLLSLFALLAITSLSAQRLIIPEPPMPRPQPGLFELELQSYKAEVEIDQDVAVTTVEQDFYNPTSLQLQGYFMYPLPEGANVQQFSMWINGKETKGELLDAKKAREIYEEIVRKALDPALLEYSKQGLLRLRIFPIQPRSVQKIKLVYQHQLSQEGNTYSYALPLYHRHDGQKPIERAALAIDLKTRESLKTIYCPTQEVEIIRKGDRRATVGFEAEKAVFASDFELFFQTDPNLLGHSLLSYRPESSEDGFFFLNLSSGLYDEAPLVAKDIAFVVDASGSMSGEKMQQAKNALTFCLEHLNPQDRFNLIRFSTEASGLFDGLKTVSKENLAKARGFVDDMEAIGGTNMEEALLMALEPAQEADRPYFIIFLTDGKPTIGETQPEQLLKKLGAKNTGRVRIFTFGVGTEINTHLLDKLTEQSRGYRTYVLPEEDIEIKVSDFYLKVAHPVLTDLRWEVEGVKAKEVYPKTIPDLFKGSNFSMLGRYSGSGKATLKLTGKVNGKDREFTFPLEFAKQTDENEFVAPLWGSRSVGYLLDQIRLNGESKELVDEVVRLAKKYGIITPYTSYLIIEDEAEQLGMNRIRRDESLLSQRVEGRTQAPKMKEAEDDLANDSGRGSVRASEEIQEMNYADNMAQTQMGRSRLEYTDPAGRQRNLADGVMNVQGRAQYLNNGQWLDSAIALQENPGRMTVNHIQFNSPEYFQLLRERPASAEFLALGRNVRFLLDGQVWEVAE